MLFSLVLLLSLASYNPLDMETLSGGGKAHNLIGPAGAYTGAFIRLAFGYSSFLLFPVFALAGWCLARKGSLAEVMERIFALAFLLVSSASLLSLFCPDALPHYSGGVVGVAFMGFFKDFLGVLGAWIVVGVFNLVGLILYGIVSLHALIGMRWKERIFHFFIVAFRRLRVLRLHKRSPLTRIDDGLKAGLKKPPWIEKKRVRVFKGRIIPEYDVPPEARVQALIEFKERLLPDIRDSLTPEDVVIDDRRSKFIQDESSIIDADALVEAGARGMEVQEAGEECADEPIEEDEEFRSVDKKEDEIENQEAAMEAEGGASDSAMDDAKEAAISDVSPAAIKEPDGADGATRPAAKKGRKASGEVQQTFDFGIEESDETAGGQRIFQQIEINRDYIIPTVFLQSSDGVDVESWKSEIIKNSEVLVATLRDFGIESRVINVNRGPVITLYEMQIAPGIKVNRIVSLSDDIALALSGSRVRIVAPIPGKSAIGVEVPNRKREMVMLGDIISSREYRSSTGFLKVALGKDILGKPVTLDLKKLPHLLIAGATGSGKSVCVNSIITSMLYNYDPNYVRFILVAPKMVELQLYNGIPHLLTPVITDPMTAPRALKWAMYEMERRYRLLSRVSTRDIERYNHKIAAYGGEFERLPYIVIIMDEMADLMMVAAKEIEGFVTRIAQKARAVGIHQVLATQRPSVDVITGVIKANFPARIAFQVAQKTDSRTIIDQNGAEKLLGKGAMLYQSPMSSFPVRIQGAFISEDEVQSIAQHLKTLGNPEYIDIDASIFEEELDDREDDEDELFVEALKIVEETKKASASYLQRRLSIGYNRAARIIELMEERGYISAQQGSKPREVFI